MGSKISIIGAGSVGATTAYTLAQRSFVSELVLIDIDRKKLEGEVMDLEQGFERTVKITAGSYADAVDSDLVIVTSGIARRPGQTRIELTQTNVEIQKSIASEITAAAPNAVYLIVSNPVDILTYVFCKVSGLPERQIIGTGTMLDTARLRTRLSQNLEIAPRDIHAYVFGEHGDTSMIPWSLCHAAGQRLEPEPEMLRTIHSSGSAVIERKGATYYAIAQVVCRLCEALLAPKPSVLTVSTMLHGEYGLEEVCLSILTLAGPQGVKRRLPIPLTAEEEQKLRQSAGALKEVIAHLNL